LALLSSPSRVRAYYATRNHTYFEWNFQSTRKIIYLANLVSYMSILLVHAIAARRLREFGELAVAVHDGLVGVLGPNRKFTL
jgi:hypothetical protein